MNENYAILIFFFFASHDDEPQGCSDRAEVWSFLLGGGGSERDFMKKLMYFSTKLVWEPERLSRENNIYEILGCEIA